MAVFSRCLTNVLCATTLLSSFYVAAGDDEYMKLLEAEAENLELDYDGQRENNVIMHNSPGNMVKRDWVGECDYIEDVLPSGLVWEEFSSYLKQCSLSTYVFYRRLKFGLQRSVYNIYLKTAPIKLSTLKEEILNYF